MSRPEVYKRVSESYTQQDRYLASTPCLYGLVYEGEWLLQIKVIAYNGQSLRKYFRHIYSTKGQARAQARKIKDEYMIEPDIVEINTDDLLVD